MGERLARNDSGRVTSNKCLPTANAIAISLTDTVRVHEDLRIKSGASKTDS